MDTLRARALQFEAQMGGPSIVVCARGDFSDVLRGALEGVPVQIDRIASPDRLPGLLESRPPLFVLDFDSLGAECESFWDALAAVQPRPQVLAIASPKRPEEVGALFIRYRATNLLARNGQIHPGDLRSTVLKILHGRIFGLEHYLGSGTTVEEQPFTGSAVKPALLELAQRCAKAAGLDHRRVEQVGAVADEMITNALYNAPVDQSGRSRHGDWPRTRPVELQPGEQATLRVGADGRRMAISVSDPFGSLGSGRVLDYLAKCFRRDDDQIDSKEGGAGLGLYLMFNAVSHFVINIAVGRRTEFIGIIDITPTYREFASRSKSFNLFVESPDPA